MDFLKEYNRGRMGFGGINGAAELGRQHAAGHAGYDSPGASFVTGIVLLGIGIIFIAPVAAIAALFLLWKVHWRSGVMYAAVFAAELGALMTLRGVKDVERAIEAVGAEWELGWLPDLLRQSVWWENMLFAGGMIGLAVAVALPFAAGWRSLACGLLCLPIGLCAALAATPLAWNSTWALVPALFPFTAIAFFLTVTAAAERGRGRGLLAMAVWGVAAAAAFGHHAYSITPPEANVEFYKRFGIETIVAWNAMTNLLAGSVIGFGSAILGGAPLVALFGRKPVKRMESWCDDSRYPSSGHPDPSAAASLSSSPLRGDVAYVAWAEDESRAAVPGGRKGHVGGDR